MTNLEILNNLIDPLYNERIPASTRTNLDEIANQILNYTPLKNAVLTEIINKIAFTIIRSNTYESIFSRFRGRDIVYGDTIEEIQPTIPVGYDPRTVGTDPFGKVQPTIKACYHTINSEMQYKQTVTDVEFRRAVRNSEGLDTLVNSVINSMNTAMEMDDDLKNLVVLSNKGVYGQVVYMGAKTGTDATDAKTLLTSIKQVASSMQFASNRWNFLRVMKQLPKRKQVIIIRADWVNKIDLDYLAGVYNLSKVELQQSIIEIPEFIGLGENVVAALISEDALMYHKALQDAGMIYNPQGVPYSNHFLNSWGVFSFSLFEDSALFVFAGTATTSLTVTANEEPVTDYVVKDGDNRIIDVTNGEAQLSAGDYTVYAQGYQPADFTITSTQVTAGTATISVALTAQA